MFRSITKRQWKLIITGLLLILAFYFILPISVPLVVALVTALMLNPLIRVTQTHLKLTRKSAVIIVFMLFLVLVGLTGTFLVTKAVTQVVNFVEDVPEHFNQLNAMYAEWEDNFQNYSKNLPPEFVNQISKSLEENLTSLSDTAKEKITIDNIAEIFAKVPQYLISFLVYLIALFLFMLELPVLKTNFYKLMTTETAEKVSFMNKRLSTVTLGFLKAQFLVSVIIFLASLIGLFFIAPNVAIIMSLIIWVIDFIPLIGSIIILAPWSLFMMLSGDISTGVKLAVLAIILLAIRRTVEPKVMGKHIDLSPLATLIAMFLGIQILGLIGFIIGPLVVITFNSAKEAGIIKWNIKI
ncbi:sporulation integral membrane protein YtvI [Virgibacillus phasianinus]|uniref:Sporulation integral membrane protein YtvI n=1 Tax=Virgibacillus phasianinus TaxID=2017483 RepID=A0A220U654_9BACI|nr:sporulation integral membrane protein YtvI [Virgibacillus phasianinus]ASK63609.1 sporulation integral membrane protein YtvI [Virgibacillus phasianinus]